MKKFQLLWADNAYREYPFGNILTQIYKTKKFNIHFWRIRAASSARLFPYSERPLIALQCMITGSFDCISAAAENRFLQQGKAALLYIPAGTCEIRLDKGDIESIFIEIEPAVVEEMAQPIDDLDAVLSKRAANSADIISLTPVTLNYFLHAVIKQIKDLEKDDPDLLIKINRHIFDLLTEYIIALREQKKDDAKNPVLYKSLLLSVKQDIMSSPHIHRHSIHMLSRKYGISQSSLKTNFKILFGISLGSFVRMQALSKARHLITTTSRSIDDISDEVGYSYRSNFDSAFKKKFGYPPSSLYKEKK